MFLKLDTTWLLGNFKKYLRIFAISLKATTERVYILEPPAYIFRGTQSGLLRLTTMIHGLINLWKWLHFFFGGWGIFHKLSPSCIYIVTSSMLEHEYLKRKTTWILKMLSLLLLFDFLSNGIMQSRSWWNFGNTLYMALSLPWQKMVDN